MYVFTDANHSFPLILVDKSYIISADCKINPFPIRVDFG